MIDRDAVSRCPHQQSCTATSVQHALLDGGTGRTCVNEDQLGGAGMAIEGVLWF